MAFFGFFKFSNWQLVLFLIFLGFFFWFLIDFRQNSKLETSFFVFLHWFWPTFEIGNWFFGFFGVFVLFVFWHMILGLDCHPKKKGRKTKKPKKKTSRYTKIGKLACFFWGEHPPTLGIS